MATINETIKLIIRTANNKYVDFQLEVSSLFTVYNLKQNISLNHPTKPEPKDQRLIFLGKLLDDSNTLNQVFVKSPAESTFMVHLVLDADKNESKPKTLQQPTIKPSQSPSPVPPTVSPHSTTYEQYMEELTKYQQQLQQFVYNPNGILPLANYEAQAYLQYCYTHHQMYQNYLAYQRTSIRPTSTIPTNQPQTQSVPAPAPAPPPPVVNNPNEFEQENDLLGTLHILVELFVLCSIIYFYSTFNRFLIVFVIFIILYLHCRGCLSIQRRRPVQVQQAPPPPIVVAEQPAGNDDEQAVNEEQVQNSNDHQQSSAVPPELVVNNPITPTRVLITAVSTFFSSIIPERLNRV